MFPIGYCIETDMVDIKDLRLLINKLILEDGYKLGWFCNEVGELKLWKYLGVNDKGDILPYDDNKHYLPVDVLAGDNILDKDWLNKYLEGI